MTAPENAVPMPLAWFDLTPPLRRVSVAADVHIAASRGGGDRTYRTEVDGRAVPFKFLCTGQPGRPVAVMLPGLGLTPVTFWPIGAEVFKSHDLLLVDYAGLWSPEHWPHHGVPVRMMARAVWRAAAAVGATRVSLVGSSMGGGMCLLSVIDAPPGITVEKLVLFNPACYPQELPGMYRMFRFPLLGEALTHLITAEKLLGGLEQIGYVDKTKVPREIHAAYARQLQTRLGRRVLMGLIRELPADARDNAPHIGQLHQIHQPTLIVWGLQDKLLVEGAGRRLAADLRGARLVEFGDLAHLPHEEAPQRVGPLVGEFLAG